MVSLPKPLESVKIEVLQWHRVTSKIYAAARLKLFGGSTEPAAMRKESLWKCRKNSLMKLQDRLILLRRNDGDYNAEGVGKNSSFLCKYNTGSASSRNFYVCTR